jgi:uncharacterized protein HemY
MLVKDLIKLLEKKIEQHESDPEYYRMMGELSIHVDRFKEIGSQFQYVGVDHNINIELDVTNGNLIISAFAEESPSV